MSIAMNWFKVSFNTDIITISIEKKARQPDVTEISWRKVIRICFVAGGIFDSDELLIFTNERPESYRIPMEAYGALDLWSEIIRRGIFDAELAIKAASSKEGEILCWPPD